MYFPKDRMVNIGGINTRYWMEGEGSPVVLIHGISNSIEDWLLNIQALAAEHRVYALDLMGHGKTDKPPRADCERQCSWRAGGNFRELQARPNGNESATLQPVGAGFFENKKFWVLPLFVVDN